MKIVEHVTLKRCPSCEHIHSVNTECKWRTPATGSGFAPRCGCMTGAEHIKPCTDIASPSGGVR